MRALFSGVCAICKAPFAKGEEINWDRETRKASHGFCFDDSALPDMDMAASLADRLGYQHFTWKDLMERMKLAKR
jgi:hypothetical protein